MKCYDYHNIAEINRTQCKNMANQLYGKSIERKKDRHSVVSSLAEFFTTLDTHLMSKYSTIWRNLPICCKVFLANLKFVFTMILLNLLKRIALKKKDFVHLHNNAQQQIRSYKIEFVHHTVPYNMNKKSLYEHMVYQN